MNKDDLDRCQHHTGVDMLKLWRHPLADVLCLLNVVSRVVRQSGQNCYTTPLCAFVQSHEKLLECRRSDNEGPGLGRRLADLGERLDGVGYHHGIWIADQLLEYLEEAVLQTCRRAEVE